MIKLRSLVLKLIGPAAGACALAGASPAAGQVLLYDPQIQSSPILAEDPLVGLPLPGATPAEYRAHMLWNLRSGLNVAALQCQFSPYLRTVDNYNAFLAHHSRELGAAYRALEGYFRRTAGATGPRRFDDYSTQTYNNFSTLQAQFGFCQVAARIGKEALLARKGELHLLAAARMRQLRGSLRPSFEAYSFSRTPIRVAAVNLTANCRDLPRRERRECERAQRRR
jgi:hypothetical protein